MIDPATCPHDTTEPVDVHTDEDGTTVTVARICTACHTQLPTGWGCDDCEWVEVRRFCDIRPSLTLATPCKEHA